MTKYDPTKHHRRSTRLKGYDYTQTGAYFVTICTHQRQALLGEIVDGVMILNECGMIVQNAWNDLPDHYLHVDLDEFCVMPNHIHGIIVLDELHPGRSSGRGGSTGRGGSQTRPQTQTRYDNDKSQTTQHGLPEIVRALKSFSPRRINQVLNSPGTPLWQRNYYEHIVRDESELNAIRQYIQNNPLKWALDQENPVNIKIGERAQK